MGSPTSFWGHHAWKNTLNLRNRGPLASKATVSVSPKNVKSPSPSFIFFVKKNVTLPWELVQFIATQNGLWLDCATILWSFRCTHLLARRVSLSRREAQTADFQKLSAKAYRSDCFRFVRQWELHWLRQWLVSDRHWSVTVTVNNHCVNQASL